MVSATYPVHIEATLDPPLSRWLWLVKWILVIPHYIVLAFLWLAFIVTSIGAFFAILFTGRYPRALFDFNVGVLRWSWRVSYYAYGALGTDRYPPFTLADVPDYPARLAVDPPPQLSRGLVLVKWWLLALPHYIIIGFFAGGGTWLAGRADDWGWSWGGGGLIGVLVLVSAVVLAFTGSYPRALFDFILGMNRWVLRVAGYAALMTDVYPPFRLDLGGQDPDGVLSVGDPAGPRPQGRAAAPTTVTATPEQPGTSAPGPQQVNRTWTGGRIASVVIGAVLALSAVGPLIGGAAVLWADRTQRDASGFISSPTTRLSTDTRALASEPLTMNLGGPDWAYSRSIIGDARLTFTPTTPDRQVFVGIASTRDATAYLSGTQYVTVTDFYEGGVRSTRHEGGAPASPPEAQDIWVASVTGAGRQTLTWVPRDGDWTIVVMNADAGPGVSVEAAAGATAPALTWVAVAMLVGGAVLLLAGVTLLVVPLTRVGAAGPGGGSAPGPRPGSVSSPVPGSVPGSGSAPGSVPGSASGEGPR